MDNKAQADKLDAAVHRVHTAALNGSVDRNGVEQGLQEITNLANEMRGNKGGDWNKPQEGNVSIPAAGATPANHLPGTNPATPGAPIPPKTVTPQGVKVDAPPPNN